MKNPSIVVLVLGLCMIGDVYGDKSYITVKNELDPKSKRLIKVYCKSGDNKVGPRYLKFEEIMEFGFKTNIWGTTEFWCRVRRGPSYRRYAAFTAYKAVKMFVTDDGTKYNWLARDDGLYFHKGNLAPYKKANWTLSKRKRRPTGLVN